MPAHTHHCDRIRLSACWTSSGSIDPATPELFDSWGSTLGPTTTLLWQYLVRRMIAGAADFTLAELAAYTGTTQSVVAKSLRRLVGFTDAELNDDTTSTAYSHVLIVPVATAGPTSRKDH